MRTWVPSWGSLRDALTVPVRVSEVKDSFRNENFVKGKWVHCNVLVPDPGMDLSNGRIWCKLKGQHSGSREPTLADALNQFIVGVPSHRHAENYIIV